jgi:hypothetical protein
MKQPKRDLAKFFDSEEKKYGMEETKSSHCEAFIGRLFQSSAEAHISHLLQKDKTLARHEAFSIYYTNIDPIIDTLCETYMGLYEFGELTIPSCKCIDEPISYFEALNEEVKAMRATQTEGYILNQMDTIQQEIAHALFRFKRIVT